MRYVGISAYHLLAGTTAARADRRVFFRLRPPCHSHDNFPHPDNSCPSVKPQSCEDYRAAATIDLEHDRHSRSIGEKLQVGSLRALWGKQGIIGKMGDPVETWKSYSSEKTQVSGRSVDCGHYIPEEQPDELLKEIHEFLA